MRTSLFFKIFGGIVLLLGVGFLNSCSTTKRDGPPSFYVDETKIPNAVPKSERLSRIGNKPVYRVRGQTYYVMSSSKGYEERGIASWYGTKFHARHTSNGERYNMLSMTAAHKTLPLPTYVQVTNLKNNKKIIVKVNDRGPFESNRLIDLSYVAAKKLGMIGHGTTWVDVKAIDPATFNKPQHHAHPATFYAHNTGAPVRDATVATNNTTKGVYLQVGLFRNKQYAERFKARVESVISSPIQVSSAENLYRVQVGPIKDIATANRISQRLKVAGFPGKKLVRYYTEA